MGKIARATRRRPSSARDETASDKGSKPSIDRRHKANLFDAVAGRVNTNGFIKDGAHGQHEGILAPEEVLFKMKNAPERFQEDDFYWADRRIESDALPESDLLKEVHCFAADLYENGTDDKTANDFKSLDASALLALGILLEEIAAGVLGQAGDLAFVEPEIFEDESKVSKMETTGKFSRTSSIGSESRISTTSSYRLAKRRRK